MKFDVVVGNPPYQGTKNNSDQLWPVFSEKAINITKENGYVSLIIPDSWTSGTKSLMVSERKNLLTDIFNKFTLTNLRFDIKKFFPGIGSGFSQFTLQKTKPNNNLTSIITETEDFSFDISGLKFIPKNPNKISLSIAKKVVDHDNDTYYFKFYGKTDNLSLTATKDAEHTYQYANTSSNHLTMWGNIPGQGYGKKKVIYARLGSKQKFEYDITGEISLMYDARAYHLEIDTTIENLKSFFESKLVRFVNKDKWSQYNEPKILNMLPIVDLSRSWTDQEIYEYFGLTQEEIAYIESQVK